MRYVFFGTPEFAAIVLEKLVSRPKIIVLEMYYIYSEYKNIFTDKIFGWMTINDYKIACCNETDILYLKK